MNLKIATATCLAFACLMSGCLSVDAARKENRYAWQNLYAGDPALAGTEVWQLPREGDVYDRTRWANRHPAEIDYFFWDGRVYQVLYFPNGDEWDKGWWPYRIRPGDREWEDVDFSYGSDPSFERHGDPRKEKSDGKRE